MFLHSISVPMPHLTGTGSYKLVAKLIDVCSTNRKYNYLGYMLLEDKSPKKEKITLVQWFTMTHLMHSHTHTQSNSAHGVSTGG